MISKAFSKESRALISDLLVKVTYPRIKLNGISLHISHFSPKDPKQRLGAEDGALGVKQHFYFAKTNWELLEQVERLSTVCQSKLTRHLSLAKNNRASLALFSAG